MALALGAAGSVPGTTSDCGHGALPAILLLSWWSGCCAFGVLELLLTADCVFTAGAVPRWSTALHHRVGTAGHHSMPCQHICTACICANR